MLTLAKWDEYPNFRKEEFDCKHTGLNHMQHDFMVKLQRLRNAYGKPIHISSGYRDATHPVEARKNTTGTHAMGIACDIAIRGTDAHELLTLAMAMKFSGIGVKQHGDGTRFIHLDTADLTSHYRPTVWSYR